ncbi:MAG: hypothetical protein H8D61_00165 [Deltaproteobacteria bacterium]|nr:hypothetical protein [Deltaproteobacteria bacterium]
MLELGEIILFQFGIKNPLLDAKNFDGLRSFFGLLQHPVLGEIIADGSPIRLSPGATSDWKSSPLLGEANRYVYLDLLGLTEQEFAAYVEEGIIA